MPTPRLSLSKRLILVADPSAYMGDLTAAMLRAAGTGKVSVVTTSTDAVRALDTHAYAAVFIDEAIGPVDGVTLTRALRSNTEGRNREVPVIMVCDAPTRALIESARDAGVTEFIRKPMSAQIIAARLAQALAAPRAFIETGAYTGPDRRRHGAAFEGEDRRQRDAG
jgi:CheY-like chemotaxis protein